MKKYQNIDLPVQERVDDLLQQMTVEEKIAQLQCTMIVGEAQNTAKDFPNGVGEVVTFSMARDPGQVAQANHGVIDSFTNNRLGIPPIIHIEALSGVVSAGATIFPSAIGLGATFDPDTIEAMADTIRQQMVSVGFRQALSPVMDVARDPRWGRIGETYGEDPTLCAQMSVAFTKGLQGKVSDGAIATGKHFLGYSMSDGGLNMATNPIPPRELREVYAKPFQAAITNGNMQGIMNSYGTIDGEMVIESKHILTDLLRGEMGFDGVCVSDYMSIDRLVNHKLHADTDTAGIAALQAGLDVECPTVKGYAGNIAQALEQGTLDMEDLDKAVKHVLTAKFRLGLFEKPHPAAETLAEAYAAPIHAKRSLETAQKSIVLLKNDGVLPLKKDMKTIAVIGPHAESVRLLFGGYTMPAGMEMAMSNSMASDMAGLDVLGSIVESNDKGSDEENTYPGCNVLRDNPAAIGMVSQAYGPFTSTILQSIQAKCPDTSVIYEQGCDVAGKDRSRFAAAVAAAGKADVVIMTMGGKYGWGANCTIGEGLDRDDIGLTGVQEELVQLICKEGKPTVFVHMDARPLSSMYIAENCNAIIENWFPGITGGQALADVLFGDYNPAGRLPVTVARNAGQIPIYSGQRNGNAFYGEETPGVLAKYVEGTRDPLFYFGEGLSYTTFEYSDLKMTDTAGFDEEISLSLTVKNTGTLSGEEVVQVYVVDELASMMRPAKEYAGCKRVYLESGEQKTVHFTMRADQFAFIDKDMNWVVEAGKMSVMVGGSSKDIRLSGEFQITSSGKIEEKTRGFYAAASIDE